ncbi:MAG: response regulator [Comamonadaceae bacterium]|nr:response regulator [Comamonadaceae bacterium]
MVVDDSETNLVLIEAILEDEGFSVKKAFSVKEATELSDYIPDLILLDLLMPNAKWFRFIEEIKTNKNYSKIPVIIVTAFANKENTAMSFDLGAIDLIEKPIDIPLFLEKVNKAL